MTHSLPLYAVFQILSRLVWCFCFDFFFKYRLLYNLNYCTQFFFLIFLTSFCQCIFLHFLLDVEVFFIESCLDQTPYVLGLENTFNWIYQFLKFYLLNFGSCSEILLDITGKLRKYYFWYFVRQTSSEIKRKRGLDIPKDTIIVAH